MHLKSHTGPINVLVLNRDDSSMCTMQTIPPQSPPTSSTATSTPLEGAAITTEAGRQDRGELQATGSEPSAAVEGGQQASGSGDAGASGLSLEELIKTVVTDEMRQNSEKRELKATTHDHQGDDDVAKEGETPMEVDPEDPVLKPHASTGTAAGVESSEKTTSNQETGNKYFDLWSMDCNFV